MSFSVKCYNCSQFGHRAKTCRRPIISCTHCNKIGHLAKACPRIRCGFCKQFGHQARDCPCPDCGKVHDWCCNSFEKKINPTDCRCRECDYDFEIGGVSEEIWRYRQHMRDVRHRGPCHICDEPHGDADHHCTVCKHLYHTSKECNAWKDGLELPGTCVRCGLLHKVNECKYADRPIPEKRFSGLWDDVEYTPPKELPPPRPSQPIAPLEYKEIKTALLAWNKGREGKWQQLFTAVELDAIENQLAENDRQPVTRFWLALTEKQRQQICGKINLAPLHQFLELVRQTVGNFDEEGWCLCFYDDYLWGFSVLDGAGMLEAAVVWLNKHYAAKAASSNEQQKK